MKNLLALIDVIKKKKAYNHKYKGIKKSGNEIVEILLKFRSRNLFIFKKNQNNGIIKEHNLLTPNTRIVFTKLR